MLFVRPTRGHGGSYTVTTPSCHLPAKCRLSTKASHIPFIHFPYNIRGVLNKNFVKILEISIRVRTLALDRPCLGSFLFVPSFLSSSFAIILVSTSLSRSTLAVPVREVSRVGYRHRARDPRCLKSFSSRICLNRRSVAIDRPIRLCTKL